jgi:hypothetical protein
MCARTLDEGPPRCQSWDHQGSAGVGPVLAQFASRTLLGWEGVVAEWAGADPNDKGALDFAQDAVEGQACPVAFGADSRRVVRNR